MTGAMPVAMTPIERVDAVMLYSPPMVNFIHLIEFIATDKLRRR